MALLLAFVGLGLSSLSARASGTNLAFQLDTIFSANSVAPTGPGPWITTTFADAPGGVLMTISNVNLTAGEKLDVADFNLNPNLSVANLTFSLQSQVGSFSAPTIGQSTDNFKADGDGYYDFQFMFQTGNNNSFMGGDSITYLVAGIPGLTPEDFAYLSKPSNGNGAGPFYAALHVQNTGSSGNNSAWTEPGSGPSFYVVPEPCLSALLGLGAAVALALRPRRQA